MLCLGLVSFLALLSFTVQAQPTHQSRNHRNEKRDYSHSTPYYNPARPLGIAYSPYQWDGSCKNLEQVQCDLEQINSHGYQIVRIYGVDCNQVWTLHTAILNIPNNNLRLFLGIYDISDIYGAIQTIVGGISHDFSRIVTISVGNELVNDGIKTASDVVNAVNEARNLLRAAGYGGPVVTVDTFVALKAHTELCHASDYVAANVHPFFDGHVYPESAGEWVRDQVNDLAAACVATNLAETGWPTAGDTIGVSVPSFENQEIALSSISQIFNNGIFSFSAFNDLWKAPGPFNCERSWGILR